MYEAKISPNVVSLTDTALTLIVVFLVTLPAMFWSGINVDTAKSAAGAGDDVSGTLIVTVSRSSLYVNGKPAAFFRLKKVLYDELGGRKPGEVVIAPDGDVPLKRLVRVFDAVRGTGAEKLVLLDDNEYGTAD